MSFVVACQADDLAPEEALRVELGGREVCIARDSEGEYHAIDDVCTHGEVSLAEGDVEGCQIECWLHGSAFDLRTGAPESPPAFQPVDVFAVDVREGQVLVDVDTRR